MVFAAVVAVGLAYGAYRVVEFIGHSTGFGEIGHAAALGLATFTRVVVVVVVSTLILVPVDVWIGMNPRVCRLAQPVVQVLASFPANFLFPLFTAVLLATGISHRVQLRPLLPLSGDLNGNVFECWTVLGAWAESTSGVEIGALVSCNAHRKPDLLRWPETAR